MGSSTRPRGRVWVRGEGMTADMTREQMAASAHHRPTCEMSDTADDPDDAKLHQACCRAAEALAFDAAWP